MQPLDLDCESKAAPDWKHPARYFSRIRHARGAFRSFADPAGVRYINRIKLHVKVFGPEAQAYQSNTIPESNHLRN
jgi:hypothetical protein